jgi:hypothetical protein
LTAVIATILVVAGIYFLLPSIKARLGRPTNLPGKQQSAYLAAGIVLLLLGLALYLVPVIGNGPRTASPPTILGVVIRKGQENGELVYYQEINYYDEDGNTNAVEWELLELSDPSQREFIDIQNSEVSDLPEFQKIRATARKTWHCNGQVYEAMLEVTLRDTDGNASEPVRYAIRCE